MLRRFLFLLLVVALSAAAREGRAQDAHASRIDDVNASLQREAVQKKRLETMLSAVGVGLEGFAPREEAQAVREFRIVWNEETATTGAEASESSLAPQTTQAKLSLASAHASVGRIRTPRSLEMTAEQVLVVAVNSDAQLRWWTLVNDPRLLRAETAGADNLLSGRVIHRPSAEFLVTLPDEAGIVELRLYKPGVGSDERLTLQLIGTVKL